MPNKITQIEVGRLYNLGNYEHVSYRLTVAVPDGCSATAAVINCERILEGLKPISRTGIPSRSDIDQKNNQIEVMKKMTALQFQNSFGYGSGTPEEIIARHEEDLARMQNLRMQACKRAEQARAAFDEMGGTEVFTDAKLDWEE